MSVGERLGEQHVLSSINIYGRQYRCGEQKTHPDPAHIEENSSLTLDHNLGIDRASLRHRTQTEARIQAQQG